MGTDGISTWSNIIAGTITAPANGSTTIDSTVIITLTSSAFSAYLGLVHTDSDWEVQNVTTKAIIFSSYINTTNKITINVPANTLSTGTAYYIRVRHNSDYHIGVWSSNINITTSITGGLSSPATLTSSHPYRVGRDMWVYEPEGYDDNSDNYPLIMFWHGYGQRGTDINLLTASGAGPMNYINGGDRPEGVLICAPQITVGDGDFTLTDFNNALSYMTTNYRINTNRVSITGLSGGAFLCRIVTQNYYAQVCSVLAFSGSYNSGWTFANYTDMGNWWHHGTADGTISNSTTGFMTNANALTVDMNISWLVTNYWGLGHSGTVWNTNGYNRRDRTNATGTAKYDYVKWLKKFSKDQVERATLHVEFAESELTIQDQRLALIQVNDLAAGATKTSLLARLTTLKSTIDAGGKRYIIDQGISIQTTSGNINNQTTHTSGSAILNLVDDEGGSSVIDFTIVNQFASTSREGNLTSDRLRGRYFGFDRQTYRDGMAISTTITNGSCKYSSLDNAKLYNIRIYAARSNNLTAYPEISVTIGGVNKTMYCELNCTEFIEYINLSPSSGEILIAIQNSGDTSTFVNVMELVEKA